MTENERRVLQELKLRQRSLNLSVSVKLEGADKKVGDHLVMKGLAARTRDGRVTITAEGLRA